MTFPDHMKITLLLGLGLLVAGCVYQVVGALVKFPFEQAGFDSRFPEKSWTHDEGKLVELANKPDLSSYYRSPVLFPADLLVMLLLAGAMGAASFHWLGYLKSGWAWMGLLLPLAYLLADLIEDCLLAWLLGKSQSIKDHFGTLLSLTRIKLVTVLASGAQTAILLVLYVIAVCRASAT